MRTLNTIASDTISSLEICCVTLVLIVIVQVEINASSYDLDHLVRFLTKYIEDLIQIIADY